MIYFIFRTVLALALTLALFILFLRYQRKSRKRSCRQPYHIFRPSICALVLIVHALLSTAPKIMDLIPLLSNQIPFSQVVVSSRQALPGTLKTEDGLIFYYAPFRARYETGRTLNLSYTPYSHFLIRVSDAKEAE